MRSITEHRIIGIREIAGPCTCGHTGFTHFGPDDACHATSNGRPCGCSAYTATATRWAVRCLCGIARRGATEDEALAALAALHAPGVRA